MAVVNSEIESTECMQGKKERKNIKPNFDYSRIHGLIFEYKTAKFIFHPERCQVKNFAQSKTANITLSCLKIFKSEI